MISDNYYQNNRNQTSNLEKESKSRNQKKIIFKTINYDSGDKYFGEF